MLAVAAWLQPETHVLGGATEQPLDELRHQPPLLRAPVALAHPGDVDVTGRLRDADVALVGRVGLRVQRGDLARGSVNSLRLDHRVAQQALEVQAALGEY